MKHLVKTGMRNKRRFLNALRIVVLLCIAFFFMSPVIMMVLGSLKDRAQVLEFNLALPNPAHFENYIHVFKTGNILTGYMNSAVITVFAVAINLLSGAFASVVIARNNTKAANTLYYYFLFGLTATMQMVTTFFLLRLIKLYGTYAGIILVFAAVNIPYTVMSTSGFIKNVPRELDDAALIDGCGPVTLVIRILLPIMKPIMITNLIITTISVWNNFTIPLYFFNGKLTIPLTVYSFFGRYARNWHYVFAAMTVTILPVIILYLCLQKYIVEGMTSGAVKG